MADMADGPPEAPPPPPPDAGPGAPPPGPPGPWNVPGWGQPSPGYGYAWPPPAGPPGSGAFRAMTVGELLDATFSLYRRNFVLIAAISAVVQVPYAAIQFVLLQVSGFATLQNTLSSLNVNARTITEAQLQTLQRFIINVVIVDTVLLVVGLLIVLPLAEAATTRAVSDRYLDRPASLGSSYGAAVRRLGALVVQSLVLIAAFVLIFALALAALALLVLVIGTPGALIGVFVFLVPALVVILIGYVRTSLAPPAIVLEHLSGWRGLTRSWRLVKGLSWRIFGIRVLVFLIAGIISAVLGGLLSLAGAGLDANGRLIVQEIVGAFTAVFIGPITYIAVTLLYYDTRIRKEGFDIEMLAQSL